MNIPIESVLTATMSGIGALVAAWIGTLLGFRRFREERSFDACLEWHRKLAEITKVLRNRIRSIPQLRPEIPEEAVVPLLKEMGQLAFQFQEMAEVASLYANRRTYAAVRDVLAEMTKSAQAFGPSRNPATNSAEEWLKMRNSSLSGLERVYNLLARDMRAMLHLELLDEHRNLDNDAS
jgi:hypothetical protein